MTLDPKIVPATDSPPVQRGSDAAGERAGILVVDDRPENLLVVRTILEDLGHDLVTVRSGEQALKCLLDRDFAVVLLDINMPGMDGLETATFIRGRQRSLHTPIIFLTAYVEEMHTTKAYALGAVDYMLTPVVPAVLRSKVKVFIDLFLMTRQVERQADQRIAFAREQAARAAAEESARRLAFLTKASDILASSLDVAANMRAMARFVVPYLADVGALTVLQEHVPVAHAEITWVGFGDELPRSETVARLDDEVICTAMHDALATGAPVEVRLERSCGSLAATKTVDGRAETLKLELGFELSSVVAVPLVARNRRLGALVLGYADRGFDAPRRALAEDIAARTAVCIDNCLLYAKVQEADQRKNEFLAMLAHELRNPLAPVRNAAQMLRSSHGDAAKLEWAANVIDRQSRHLVRLVDDLLDVARITQGKITLTFEAVDVATVVSMAEEMTRQLVESRKHTLTVRLPGTPLAVYGDCARIAQILGNLLNNAAKYSEPGSAIALEVDESGGEVVFRVRDSGIGIPADILGSIFDLFIQADRSLDRSQGGLGIGLTIVRNLVHMQGGTVQASSAGPGKGSEFVVRLPRVASQRAAEVPLRSLSSPSALRILVVDDHPDAAESMAALMQGVGHQSIVAHDGPAAIAMAKSFRPDVILLDIGLPGMNGFEVARALKAAPETTGCVLIAVSGYGQAEDQQRSREVGFDHHLVKPADFAALERILDTIRRDHVPSSGQSTVLEFPAAVRLRANS
jgi:signal transduction histidine kinase/DNA-binding response OmpR family regulator